MRVYVDQTLAAGGRVRLTGNAAHHLGRVLRLRPGAQLSLFNGRGGEYAARVDDLRREEVVLSLGAFDPGERESPLDLTLIQGIARGERMDAIVQKATELGAQHIIPLQAARSVVQLAAAPALRRIAHWQGVAIAACEQCGRNRLPTISAPAPLAQVLRNIPETGMRVTLSPWAAETLTELPSLAAVTLLIGPEGGLTQDEIALASQAGFVSRRMGPRVLRTETASLAALAILQARHGDLSR
jgi:16S rRNA (uracil1498-N3)-methyltransferase